MGRVNHLAANPLNSELQHLQLWDSVTFKFYDHDGNYTSDPSAPGIEAVNHMSEKIDSIGMWVTMKIFPRASNVVEGLGPILFNESKSKSVDM